MNKPITKIVNKQLDIKLGQFIPEELNIVLIKIKSKKAAGLNKTPRKCEKKNGI